MARPSAPGAGYGRSARILSVGIAATGVVTFAYFSLASYALDPVQYKRISLLWSIMFVIASVIYRPIEQLLSRTIADRRARGLHQGHPLRVPLLIQAAFASVFLVVALVLRSRIEDKIFDGSSDLYWILVAGVLAYAASYFARGFVAGHQRFALYGALVFMEGSSRLCFALAAIVGVTSGQSAVALGMAAAPFVSLVVVPIFFLRRDKDPPADPAVVAAEEGGLSMRHGAGFAVAVFAVMLSEQTLINAAVLTVDGTSKDPALAGIVFNVLLISRAPLQLFQAIQGSLLPHLAGLEATAGRAEFDRAIRITVTAMASFGLAVAIGLFAVGPTVMNLMFDLHEGFARAGLALVGLGMGFHLAAGTLNQAALARGQARAAAAAWLVCAVAFLSWMVSPVLSDQLLRTEVGYCAATALLCGLLSALYRRGPRPVLAGGLRAAHS